MAALFMFSVSGLGGLFDEDTPQRLIGEILLDLLVKGGDYKPGRDCRQQRSVSEWW